MVSFFIAISVAGFLLIGLGLLRLFIRRLADLAALRKPENSKHYFVRNHGISAWETISVILACGFCLGVIILYHRHIVAPEFSFVIEVLTPAIYAAPVVIWWALRCLHKAMFEIEVDGAEVIFRSVFRSAAFPFSDIEDAVYDVYMHEYTGNFRFTVFGRKYKLSTGAVNFGFFQASMAKHGIVTESNLSTRSKLLPLTAIFPLVILLAFSAWPFLILMQAVYSDGIFLYGVYTAAEVLTGYLIWYRVIMWCSAQAFFILIVGNTLAIGLLWKKGILTKLQICVSATAMIIVLIIGIIANVDFDEPANHTLIRWAWEDLHAIEQGELMSTTNRITLDGEFERLWFFDGPSSSRHPYTVYRMHTNERLAVHYPFAIAPALIREILDAPEFQVPGYGPRFRVYEIRYTPNFRIVVEIIPKRGGV